ncbi:MAG: hypothetical protein V4671_00895 [Armatimonadota bacterium]
MITILNRIEELAAFPAEVRAAVCALAPSILLGHHQASQRLSKQIVLKLRQVLQPEYHPALPRSGCGNDWLDTHLMNFGAPMFQSAVEQLVLMHLNAKDDQDNALIIEKFNHLVVELHAHYTSPLALAA